MKALVSLITVRRLIRARASQSGGEARGQMEEQPHGLVMASDTGLVLEDNSHQTNQRSINRVKRMVSVVVR